MHTVPKNRQRGSSLIIGRNHRVLVAPLLFGALATNMMEFPDKAGERSTALITRKRTAAEDAGLAVENAMPGATSPEPITVVVKPWKRITANRTQEVADLVWAEIQSRGDNEDYEITPVHLYQNVTKVPTEFATTFVGYKVRWVKHGTDLYITSLCDNEIRGRSLCEIVYQSSKPVVDKHCMGYMIIAGKFGSVWSEQDYAILPCRKRGACGAVHLDISNRSCGQLRQDYWRFFQTDPDDTAAETAAAVRFLLVIKVYPTSRKALAVQWQREGCTDDGVVFVATALDFGLQPLSPSNKQHFAADMDCALPGVSVDAWVRVAPQVPPANVDYDGQSEAWYPPAAVPANQSADGGNGDTGSAAGAFSPDGAKVSAPMGSKASGAHRPIVTIPGQCFAYDKGAPLAGPIQPLHFDCGRLLYTMFRNYL